jgi:protein TonB
MQYVQRANNTTRLVGLGIVVGFHALIGYALATGLGSAIIQKIAEPIVTEIIEDIPEEEEVPPPPPPVDIDLPPPPTQVILPEIRFDTPPPANAIQQVVAVTNPAPPPVRAAPPPPAPTGPRVWPRLRRAGIPDYPAAALRLEEEGTTTLEACVNAEGRVDEVTLKSSSGSDRLDKAAMDWIKRERFTPGSLGGEKQKMCTTVPIEWKLENAR